MIKKRDPQIVALDRLSLGRLNILAAKAKLGAEIMDKIAICAACGAVPWTDDLVRHQKALLRGASLNILVCKDCW